MRSTKKDNERHPSGNRNSRVGPNWSNGLSQDKWRAPKAVEKQCTDQASCYLEFASSACQESWLTGTARGILASPPTRSGFRALYYGRTLELWCRAPVQNMIDSGPRLGNGIVLRWVVRHRYRRPVIGRPDQDAPTLPRRGGLVQDDTVSAIFDCPRRHTLGPRLIITLARADRKNIDLPQCRLIIDISCQSCRWMYITVELGIVALG